MIRKRERVIGTLSIWVVIMIVLGMILDRLNYAHLNVQNLWYYYGNIVTGSTPEDAFQLITDMQTVTQNLHSQLQDFARAELFSYLPLFLLICLLLIAAGVLSTFFIWRAALVPEAVLRRVRDTEAEDEDKPASALPLARLLHDDGELAEDDPAAQTVSSVRQE